MRAGLLRHRVTVEVRPDTDDGYGNDEARSWAALAGLSRVAADIRPQRDSDPVAAGAPQAEIVSIVRLRRSAASAAIPTRARLVAVGGPFAGRSGPVLTVTPSIDGETIDLAVAFGAAE